MTRAAMRATMLEAGLAAVALLAPAVAAAQVANALPRSTAMGGSYTALARGFSAVLWNPAGLGLPGNPRLSFSLLPVSASAGLGPVTLGDVARYDGALIPHETRVRWLDAIRAEGGEAGVAGTDVTYLIFNIGQVAVSASSAVRGRVNIGPDVAELVLFGNAGLTGDPRDYRLEGSSLDLAGTTTLAASLGVPLRVALGPLPDQHLAVGATFKYTVGHFLVLAEERGSSMTTDPLEVRVHFPVIHTFAGENGAAGSGGRLHNGGGFGLDVGAAWQAGIFSAGVTIRNLVSTFEWDREALRYRAGTAAWTADSSFTRFEDEPFENAPADLAGRIGGFYTFAPVVAVGGAARVLPFLTLTGEARHAVHDNLHVGARSHLGVGGELTAVPSLPLRAGLAAIPGGYQLSGGLGAGIGGAQLSFAAAHRDAELGSDTLLALALTFVLR